MPIKRQFVPLGAAGEGTPGVVLLCDACRRRGPVGLTPAEVAAAARRAGFTAVRSRRGSRGRLLWVCRACFAERPVRLWVAGFIAARRRRRRKGGGR
jgi:hypothetical protein